jgi:subtilase family serine protease
VILAIILTSCGVKKQSTSVETQTKSEVKIETQTKVTKVANDSSVIVILETIDYQVCIDTMGKIQSAPKKLTRQIIQKRKSAVVRHEEVKSKQVSVEQKKVEQKSKEVVKESGVWSLWLFGLIILLAFIIYIVAKMKVF